MRSLVVHYHCYKNAGSTVDRSVTGSLGRGALLEVDKHESYRDVRAYNRAFFEEIIPLHPEVVCFSSHRTVPSVHLIEEYNVIPVLFLRHPLLRVASVYRFEAKRNDGDQYEDARRFGFRDWLESRIDDPNGWEARNYQSCLFSIRENGQPDLVPGSEVREVHFDRLMTRMKSLPLIGFVEEFDRSAELFMSMISPHIPGFSLGGNVNRTKETSDWNAELGGLVEEIGSGLKKKFDSANAQDLELFAVFRSALIEA